MFTPTNRIIFRVKCVTKAGFLRYITMFPWFTLLNRLLQSLSRFNKKVASIAYSDSLNDKQKVAQIKMLLITSEDDLSNDVSRVLEQGLFTPEDLPHPEAKIITEKLSFIDLTYGLN